MHTLTFNCGRYIPIRTCPHTEKKTIFLLRVFLIVFHLANFELWYHKCNYINHNYNIKTVGFIIDLVTHNRWLIISNVVIPNQILGSELLKNIYVSNFTRTGLGLVHFTSTKPGTRFKLLFFWSESGFRCQ